MNTSFVRWPKLLKPWFELLQSLGTIAALIAGLWWFLVQRSTYQNLKLEQTITQRPIPGAGLKMVTIDVRVTNIGKVGINLKESEMDVYQLIPKATKELSKFKLDAVYLQPGESDQVAFESPVYPDVIKSIQVNSYYEVPDTGKYWELKSAADLGSATEGSSQTSSSTNANPSNPMNPE